MVWKRCTSRLACVTVRAEGVNHRTAEAPLPLSPAVALRVVPAHKPLCEAGPDCPRKRAAGQEKISRRQVRIHTQDSQNFHRRACASLGMTCGDSLQDPMDDLLLALLHSLNTLLIWLARPGIQAPRAGHVNIERVL